MGFRLFRRIRVAPGISLNLSKSGFSVSAGVRGAHVTVGPRGVRRTVGLPGTGIYYTTTSSRAKARAANASANADDRAPVDDQLLGQRQATGSGGCLLLLLCAALFFGIYLGSAGHVAPSDTGSAPTPSPTVAPTPMPLTVSTDLPATVARRARIATHVATLPGARCTIAVPAAARTGAAPKAATAGIDGIATVAWRAGSTPGRFALTVTCAAGPERLALAATLRIR